MSPLKEINQQAYYNAINRSTDAVNSGIFIDFMLQEIYETLKKRQGDPIVTMKATKDVGINVGINEQKVLELLRKNNQITAKEITGLLGISLRHSERLITSLKQKGMIQRVGSNKNGYWEIIVKATFYFQPSSKQALSQSRPSHARE